MPSNGIFDFRLNIWKGIEYWATNKAVGTDGIPGKFFKDLDKTTLIKRLKNTFYQILTRIRDTGVLYGGQTYID